MSFAHKKKQKLMPGTDYQIGVVKDIHVEQCKRDEWSSLSLHAL